jgi:hypothetical protein
MLPSERNKKWYESYYKANRVQLPTKYNDNPFNFTVTYAKFKNIYEAKRYCRQRELVDEYWSDEEDSIKTVVVWVPLVLVYDTFIEQIRYKFTVDNGTLIANYYNEHMEIVPSKSFSLKYIEDKYVWTVDGGGSSLVIEYDEYSFIVNHNTYGISISKPGYKR